jgi:hypothetical protein
MTDRGKVLITGAGGFIGHHLVTYLKGLGYWVRGVDLHYPEFTPVDTDEFMLLDLRRWEHCLRATEGIEEVYALAADMGGMGFISAHHAAINQLADIIANLARVRIIKKHVPGRRRSGAATRITRAYGRSWVGSRRSPLKKGWRAPTPGSKGRWRRPSR